MLLRSKHYHRGDINRFFEDLAALRLLLNLTTKSNDAKLASALFSKRCSLRHRRTGFLTYAGDLLIYHLHKQRCSLSVRGKARCKSGAINLRRSLEYRPIPEIQTSQIQQRGDRACSRPCYKTQQNRSIPEFPVQERLRIFCREVRSFREAKRLRQGKSGRLRKIRLQKLKLPKPPPAINLLLIQKYHTDLVICMDRSTDLKSIVSNTLSICRLNICKIS
jgi:hypothetical protein